MNKKRCRVWPILMVVAIAFLFERKETLEIKDGYVIIGKVSLWGCRKTENSRLPVCDVKDIVVKPACVLPGAFGDRP